MQYGFQESADIARAESGLLTQRDGGVKHYLQDCLIHTVSSLLQLERGLATSSGDTPYVLILGALFLHRS